MVSPDGMHILSRSDFLLRKFLTILSSYSFLRMRTCVSPIGTFCRRNGALFKKPGYSTPAKGSFAATPTVILLSGSSACRSHESIVLPRQCREDKKQLFAEISKPKLWLVQLWHEKAKLATLYFFCSWCFWKVFKIAVGLGTITHFLLQVDRTITVLCDHQRLIRLENKHNCDQPDHSVDSPRVVFSYYFRLGPARPRSKQGQWGAQLLPEFLCKFGDHAKLGTIIIM